MNEKTYKAVSIEGKSVEIPFESFIENVIDKAIIKHKDTCPAKDLETRIKILEIYSRILIGSLVPVYLWGLAVILDKIKTTL